MSTEREGREREREGETGTGRESRERERQRGLGTWSNHSRAFPWTAGWTRHRPRSDRRRMKLGSPPGNPPLVHSVVWRRSRAGALPASNFWIVIFWGSFFRRRVVLPSRLQLELGYLRYSQCTSWRNVLAFVQYGVCTLPWLRFAGSTWPIQPASRRAREAAGRLAVDLSYLPGRPALYSTYVHASRPAWC